MGELDNWNDILSRELGKFKKGEEYDYVTDMRRAYANGLATTELQAIYKTIPDYVFWDIKKPLKGNDLDVPRNRYNPARADPIDDFFEARKHEQWLVGREANRNVNTTITRYRQY